jgi:hypothetical protein
MNTSTFRLRRALAWGLALALALPWLIGQWVKTTLQPGISDAAASASLLVDYIVIGTSVFGVALWLVVACGCWIVHVMKSPQRFGDPFPAEEPRSPA